MLQYKYPFPPWVGSESANAADCKSVLFKVVGSTPTLPTILYGAVAQLGAQFPCKEKVRGSSPLGSTTADSAAISIDTPVQIRRVFSGLATLKPDLIHLQGAGFMGISGYKSNPEPRVLR